MGIPAITAALVTNTSAKFPVNKHPTAFRILPMIVLPSFTPSTMEPK